MSKVTDMWFSDFLDYSEKLVIKHHTDFLMPFSIWDHQSDVVNKLLKKKEIASLSARQMGMTTLMMIVAHWYTNTFPKKKVYYTSHNQTMLNTCREFYKQLDYLLSFKTSDAYKLVLRNDSVVQFGRIEKELLCSDYVDMLLIDNAAYIDGKGGWWSQIKSNIKEDGYLWVNSTPSDKTTWFYQAWVNWNKGKKIKLPWDKHPHRNEDWYELQKHLQFGSLSVFENEVKANFV